jgi:hypothetical protein
METSFGPELGSPSGHDTRIQTSTNNKQISCRSPLFTIKMYVKYTRLKSTIKSLKDVSSYLFCSVGLAVANAPGCTAAMWLIVLPLDVKTLTTSRLPKRSWQSEVELNFIIFLDIPTFTTSRLPRVPSSQRWQHVGETWPMNFAWNAWLPRNSQGSFTCRKSTTWDRRLYFPSEGRHAEDTDYNSFMK